MGQASVPARTPQPRVFVVDDERPVREVLSKLLGHLGCSVEAFGSAREALTRFSANPLAVDLVILDVTMPDVSGPECQEALEAIDPLVRVVFSSGHAPDKAGGRPAGFLRKPYVLESLRRIVEECALPPRNLARSP